MVKVYYKDKIIVFDSTNREYSQRELLFYNGEVKMLDIDNIVAKLEYVEKVVIIYEDVLSCVKEFEKQFVMLEAAGGVVRNSSADTLMIYRNKIWDLPKGKLEANEKIEQCAVREVIEECGIEQITLEKLRVKTMHIYPLSGVWHFKTTWWYDMFSDFDKLFTPQIEEGIAEVRWIPVDEMKSILLNTYSTIVSVIYSNNNLK